MGELGADRSVDACSAMSLRVRQSFDSRKSTVSQRPVAIREWVTGRFSENRPKTFLELGAHTGTDTEWMAALPAVTIHAFEPDPRNHPPGGPNVIVIRAAVADREGRAPFIPSRVGWGREWTYSSSLRRPKNHLHRFPVEFGESIDVDTVTLDGYCRRAGLGPIDLVWAKVQGSEGDMLRGGAETLARTHYLFTQYSDDELYEGQITLNEILALLPAYRVVELYDEDVLLENTRWGR
jgi:FkbM family methyltransferase